MKRVLSIAVAAALSAGCTHMPARTVVGDDHPGTVTTSIERIAKDKAERRAAAAATVELHPEDRFMIGFVELHDQGGFYNESQFHAVQEAVEAALFAGGRARPAIVVGFVHGWRHNAAVCDRDVNCFREVLRGLAIYEAARAAACARHFPAGTPYCEQRQIVGVMLGWRGAPLRRGPLERLNVLSFYSRKNAAHTIGQAGNVASVVGWLNRLDQRLAQAEPPANGGKPSVSRLILAGHSFGGAMLFSSVDGVLHAQIADQRFLNGLEPVECDQFRPAGVGDLIVLLNPAFEALRYDSIDAATRTLTGCTRPRSALVTLASRTDRYNGFWFRVGRTLSTAFDRFEVSAQRREARQSLGHYEPQQTHRLEPNPSAAAVSGEDDTVFGASPSAEKGEKPNPCLCRNRADEAKMKALADSVYGDGPRRNGREVNLYAQMATPAASCDTPSCLTAIERNEDHNPFKVVTVDRAIIDGHSDIYNPQLLDFLVRSVAAADAPRPQPAQR
jgi:hypothetical protein